MESHFVDVVIKLTLCRVQSPTRTTSFNRFSRLGCFPNRQRTTAQFRTRKHPYLLISTFSQQSPRRRDAPKGCVRAQTPHWSSKRPASPLEANKRLFQLPLFLLLCLCALTSSLTGNARVRTHFWAKKRATTPQKSKVQPLTGHRTHLPARHPSRLRYLRISTHDTVN